MKWVRFNTLSEIHKVDVRIYKEWLPYFNTSVDIDLENIGKDLAKSISLNFIFPINEMNTLSVNFTSSQMFYEDKLEEWYYISNDDNKSFTDLIITRK